MNFIKDILKSSYKKVLTEGVFILSRSGTFIPPLPPTPPPIPPDGTECLIDNNGNYLRDNEGYWLISPLINIVPIPPDGCRMLIDNEGYYLCDNNGYWLIAINDESQGTFYINKNGDYYINKTGNNFVSR